MRKVLKKWLIYVVVLCLVLPVGFVSQTSKVEAQPLFDDTIPGWVIFTTEQIDLNAFSFKQDDQEKYEGNYSLMLSLTMPSVSEGQYVSAETTFSVEPNTTYSLSMMVKGESVGRVYATDYGWSNGIQITKLPESTFDWQEFGYSFNSGDKTVWTLAILVVEPVGKLWIDNVKVTKQGSDENIVNNPGFEEKKQLSTAEQLDLIESNLPMLENLIVQVEAQGIPTDYERVNLQTIKDFIEYGREDLASNQLARAAYVARVLQELYDEAVTNLEAYLEGSKEPKVVPRYLSQRVDIEDYAFIGDTKLPTGEIERRPIFFSGFGHFGQVSSDVPKFTDYGFNIIQYSLMGPSQVMEYGLAPYWSIGHTELVEFRYGLDEEVKHGEEGYSLWLSLPTENVPIGHFGAASQLLEVEPNTTYHVSMWIKGENVGDTMLTTPDWSYYKNIPTGTFDWQEFTGYSFTTGDKQTLWMFQVLVAKTTGKLWIDDIKITKEGSDENILKNSGFDIKGQEGVPHYYDIWLNHFKATLEAAEEHNIAVDFMLSPHNMPPGALTTWPDMVLGNGFIPYDIHHPKAREIIEDYIRYVLPQIKDYKSLHSISLSNEPQYFRIQGNERDRAAWKEHLEDLYGGDIEKLNDTYGTSFANFESIPFPAYGKTPQFYDYMLFLNKRFAEWHEWMADIIHEIAPDIPVHSKILPQNNIFVPSLLNSELGWGVDPELFGAFSQLNGNDNFNLIGWQPDGFVNAMEFYDLLGSLHRQPSFNSENHIIPDGFVEYGAAYIPKHVVTTLWQSAIHGMGASTMWVWERPRGEPSFEGSVLTRPDVVAAMGKLNLDVNRLSWEIKAFQDEPAKVAVLYTLTSKFYDFPDYTHSMLNTYAALSYTGNKVDFISEKQIREGKLNEYDLLVVPYATHVWDSTLQGIRQFVERPDKAGHLVIIGEDTLMYNEHNKALSEADRSAVFTNAHVFPKDTARADMKTYFFGKLAQIGLSKNRAVLIDANTNKPVEDIEWRSVKYGGKLLINVANYSTAHKQVYIEVNGERLNTVKDLISGETLTGGKFAIGGLTPYMFEADLTNWVEIVSIEDLEDTVKVGEAYELPKYVEAKMSDDSTQLVPVAWNPSEADTGKAGVYTFEGKVEGYTGTVKLVLTVVAPTPPPVPGPVLPPSSGQDKEDSEDTEGEVVTIDGVTGGSASWENVSIEFLPGALTSEFRVVVAPVTDISDLKLDENTFIVGTVISITKDVEGKFNQPVTVTIKLDLKELDLEQYNYGLYWYDEEAKVWVPLDNVRLDLASGTISGKINHFTMFAVLAVKKAAELPELSDIENSWAKEDILRAVALGIVSGYPDGTFKPDNTITRAEFIKLVVKALRLEEREGKVFTDTAGHWAERIVATAEAYGIVSGYDDERFGPDDPVTREQMMVILANALGITGEVKETGFTDHADISAWAVGSVAELNERGLINGYPDGSFRPKQAATRAEAVVMILRALQ